MKLGVFSPVLNALSLEDGLKYLSELGVEAMELGAGGWPGTKHADAVELIQDDSKIEDLRVLFAKYNISISAISVHGNPVHPDKKIADTHNNIFEAACILAGKLGVERIVTFSGCPGDGTSMFPNWVTCAWPNDFKTVLDYQWNEVLIPYWKSATAFAEKAGVKYICLEMHPGFSVYNPETLLRLRNSVGDMICANFDPSHLFWQGIDIVTAIKYLGKAIQFFHAKDTEFNKAKMAVKGVIDVCSYADPSERSWIFRTVGYGHDEREWKSIISALRVVGYDHVVSIEHEDCMMTPREGLEKAVDFLKNVIIKDINKGRLWWV